MIMPSRVFGSGRVVDLGDPAMSARPYPTSTWNPLRHQTVVSLFKEALKSQRIGIISEEHLLSTKDRRYFGVFDLNIEGGHGNFVAGLRNAHDKEFRAGMVAGHRVTVCSNLAFYGEHQTGHKHTRWIHSELLDRFVDCLAGLRDKFIPVFTQTLGQMERQELQNPMIAELLWDMVKNEMLLADQAKAIWTDGPAKDPELMKPTLWTLWNDTTEKDKGRKLAPDALAAVQDRRFRFLSQFV